MDVLGRVRSALFSASEPPFYWQLWLTGVNLVGLLVVVGILFDLRAVLGPDGRAGIYQRALYPLFPAALTLGVALWERRPRRVLLSGGALAGYVVVLAWVGLLAELFGPGRSFLLAGLFGCVVFCALGAALAARAA
jgi:hypothetical protein